MNPTQIATIFIVACYIGWSNAASLPDFIIPCKGTDPNLNQCADKVANDVIPHLLNGYPALNIPVLAPLEIEHIRVENSDNLSILINGAVIRGLENAKASNFNIDLKSHNIRLRLTIPKLNIQGEYKMSGRLLFLPLNGKGPCDITAKNGDYDIDISYNVYDQGGVEYAKLENVHVQLGIKGAHFHFANLLNTNEKVSDDINSLLNKEWRQVIQDLEPAIKEAVALIVIQVVNGIIDKVPYTEIFANSLP